MEHNTSGVPGGSRQILNLNLATLLFGFTPLFGKILNFSPVLIVVGRTFFAALVLMVAVLIKKHKFSGGTFAEYSGYARQGFLLCVLLVAYYRAIQVSTVAIGNLAYATFPVFVVFTESFFFREKLRRGDFVSALLVVLGVFFMIPEFEWGNSAIRGISWGFLSGFALAFLFVVRRKAVHENKSSLVTTFYEQFFCFIFLLPLAIFYYDPVITEWRNLFFLALLGVVFSAFPFYLLISSLVQIKAKLAGIIISVEPVYGILFAVFLLGEIPGWRTVVGGLVILFAAFYETFRSGRVRKEDLPRGVK